VRFGLAAVHAPSFGAAASPASTAIRPLGSRMIFYTPSKLSFPMSRTAY
jgi:hypothetical protein